MKKFLIVLLSLILGTTALAFAACADNAPNNNTPSAGNEQTTPGDRETPADPGEDNTPENPNTPGTPGTGGSVLVVYFSAQGHTEEVAGYIAQAAGGDLFELTPVDPYTADDLNYNDHNSRVYREYLDESLRDVELSDTAVAGWENYDVVFIGYPIWWGIAAWPVNGFVEANDFTGKTVIPFCTSASSGLGQSGALLEELAGTGNWQEGQRFRSSASEEDVAAWVESLDIG
ncbi:MAG TPA: hypothetical protein H9729_02250 [Candidatus Borkfalkia excrementigallinarum]|uniref:Flavodoxin-like domain-containing protein n=1 Tax=Candidatus Borkfalkia excrementigallinarum TaxID=2838506 RepID=A0A9D1ZU31_9FIRM|nr:hypothetical protein [Candidatus Borkfalkia excrementigallinarum]